jgi:hypothetical protein
MTRAAKIGVVFGGYIAAIVAGIVAAQLYNAHMAAQPYDTSGGMYAGGELLTSLAAFLTVALVPTLLALWFLRRHEGFWNVVAIASLAFAGFGLLAVLTPLAARNPGANIALMLVDLFGLLQLLGVPLWFAAFALFAFLAPTPPIRRKLVVAAAIELGVGFCALVHWFVPGSPW